MKIYIDSNVFVSHICEDEDNHKSSKDFIDFILNRDLTEDIIFLTSRFTEVEIASAIFRKTKNEERARATLHKLERPWKEKFHLLPENPNKKINLDDLIIKLVETALRHGTPFADTIHANDIESYNIEFLVTWNIKDFERMKDKIKNLQIVTPIQMLMELRKILEK